MAFNLSITHRLAMAAALGACLLLLLSWALA
jgi:hypothetical protein